MTPGSVCVVYLVEGAHGGARGRDHIVDEEEKSVLRAKVDPFSNQKVELAHGQIGGDQILLLVQVSNTSFRSLLHDHLQRNTVPDERYGESEKLLSHSSDEKQSQASN